MQKREEEILRGAIGAIAFVTGIITILLVDKNSLILADGFFIILAGLFSIIFSFSLFAKEKEENK